VTPALAFLVSSQKQQVQSDESTQQQQDARLAIDRFTRELREAGYPDGHTYQDSQIFLAANENDVTFYSDTDNDRTNEKIRYYLDTSTHQLMRSVTEPDCSVSPCSYVAVTAVTTTSPVIPNVRNDNLTGCSGTGSQPTFTYFKKDTGTGGLYPTPIPTPVGDINDLVDIYYLKLVTVVDVTPGKAPTCQTLSTAVQLRNWKG
jgi:hypothetical protein